VNEAVAAYRQEADTIGQFLAEYTRAEEKGRLSTSLLYSHYSTWAKENGYRPLSQCRLVSPKSSAEGHKIRESNLKI
jgi:phage/plasmid-associated DNA primase